MFSTGSSAVLFLVLCHFRTSAYLCNYSANFVGGRAKAINVSSRRVHGSVSREEEEEEKKNLSVKVSCTYSYLLNSKINYDVVYQRFNLTWLNALATTIKSSPKLWTAFLHWLMSLADLPQAIQEITDSISFSSMNLTHFCLKTRSLHCDRFLPLATFGVSVGQLELHWIELNLFRRQMPSSNGYNPPWYCRSTFSMVFPEVDY